MVYNQIVERLTISALFTKRACGLRWSGLGPAIWEDEGIKITSAAVTDGPAVKHPVATASQRDPCLIRMVMISKLTIMITWMNSMTMRMHMTHSWTMKSMG